MRAKDSKAERGNELGSLWRILPLTACHVRSQMRLPWGLFTFEAQIIPDATDESEWKYTVILFLTPRLTQDLDLLVTLSYDGATSLIQQLPSFI